MAGRRSTKQPVASYSSDAARLAVMNKPYKSYIKTILGKVQALYLSPITNQMESIILVGDPRLSYKEGCIIDVFNEVGDKYLKQKNKRLLETGYLIPYTRTEFNVISEEEAYNSMSEEELKKVVDSDYYSILAVLEKITSVATLFRIITLAQEMEKSEKIIEPMKKRLEVLQKAEYGFAEPKEEKPEEY